MAYNVASSPPHVCHAWYVCHWNPYLQATKTISSLCGSVHVRVWVWAVFFRGNARKPLYVSVKVSKTGTVLDLKAAIQDLRPGLYSTGPATPVMQVGAGTAAPRSVVRLTFLKRLLWVLVCPQGIAESKSNFHLHFHQCVLGMRVGDVCVHLPHTCRPALPTSPSLSPPPFPLLGACG